MHTFKKNHWGLFSLLLALLTTTNCTRTTERDLRIRQSNHVYEDNVNGRTPPPDNVIESTNFYYNEDGTLNSATVYSDTTSTAHLLKEIHLTYGSDKVIADTYLDTIGNTSYTITFNNKKQVTSVYLPDSSGLYITYFNDRISGIKVLPSGNEYLGFIYDDNDNLLQYDLKINGFIVGRALLEYDNGTISQEFDSRFLTKEIKFIYLGGLDLISKLGLNYGKSTQNKLIKRTEVNLLTGQVSETYQYGYLQNTQGDIIKRNVRFSNDTLYYQFKY